MKAFLYEIVSIMAKLNVKLLELNDAYEYNISNEELHFLVIGIFGLLLVFIIQPIFQSLAKKNLVLVITWLYVTTILLVLTFSIEIGQTITHTGKMEFGDVVAGMGGFFYLFAIYVVIRLLVTLVKLIIKRKKRKPAKRIINDNAEIEAGNEKEYRTENYSGDSDI